MGDNLCKSSFFCISAFFVVCLSILAQVLVVGLFFVQPYFQDCEPLSYISPIQSAGCLSDSAANIPIILPSNCSASNTLQRQFCYDSGCGTKNMTCPGSRCCCRPIPQVTRVDCATFGTRSVSYSSSCVYTVCEKTRHSVLLQVYDSSQVNNLSNSSLPKLQVQFGNTLKTTSNGKVLLTGIEEGEYPISIQSTSHFHASTLSITFYSPPEVVYIVYVKVLSTSASVMHISDCNITSNISNQMLHTTRFSNSLNDLLTLPNNFMYNNSFFIPAIVAFSTSISTTINFTVNCTDSYTLFQYSRNGTWSSSTAAKTNFEIRSKSDSILWSLSNRISEASCTQYINPNNSTLFLDRGSVLILTDGWFASRVTTDNRTILAIPVICNTSLKIRYTSSLYSLLPAQSQPIIQLGNTSTTLTDNCTSREDNLYNVTPSTATYAATFAILSVTNTKLPICYIRHNFTGIELISLTADDSGNDSLFLSALQTNANSVCLPCPCGFNVTLKGTTDMRMKCPSIDTVNSNALRLLECNN